MATTLVNSPLCGQAIVTRYMGATNHLPARVCAVSGNGRNRLTMTYDDDVTTAEAHAKVAVALANKLGWHGALAQGGIGNGYAFVYVNKDKQ